MIHHLMVEDIPVGQAREKKIEDVDADDRDERQRQHLSGYIIPGPC